MTQIAENAHNTMVNKKFEGLSRTNSFAGLVEIRANALASAHSEKNVAYRENVDELERLLLQHDVKLFGGASWQVALERLNNFAFVDGLVKFIHENEGNLDKATAFMDDVDAFELRDEKGVGTVLYMPLRIRG